MFLSKFQEAIKNNNGRAFIVGGSVRDKLLEKPNFDIDIEVFHINADTLKSILEQFGTVNYFGAHFGIYTLNEYPMYDFALPRTEIKIGERHIDFDVYISPNISYEEAARRRDFTINALMEDIHSHEILDYFNGLNDLKNRIIRHIQDETFVEDPLRAFRAAQFAARLNFTIAPSTSKLIQQMTLNDISKERILEENRKGFLSPHPDIYFSYLQELNILEKKYPEFLDISHVELENIKIILQQSVSIEDKTLNFYAIVLALFLSDIKTFLKKFLLSKNDQKDTYLITTLILELSVATSDIELRQIKVKLHCLNKKGRQLFFDIVAFILSHRSFFSFQMDFIDYEDFNQRWFSAISNNTAFSRLIEGKDLIALGFTPGLQFRTLLQESLNLEIQGYTKKEILQILKAKISTHK